MKRVLREVLDKNGGSEMIFSPTARMVLFSVFKSEGLSDDEACDRAKIDRQLPARWKAKYGSYFMDWLEEAIDQGGDDDAKILERVGMVNAIQGNFQFWREMARTKGVIKEDEPKKGLTINTDFTVILQAVGGDIHAARARLLQAARGVAVEGGPRMALPAHERQPSSDSSAGNRADDVQGGPVEMAHALGADRGRPKQGTTLPAVPQQDTFASSYVVLDEGEIPPSS